MRITFEEVSAYGEKRGKCSRCGKTHKRRKKFTHTINPFNRKSNGQVKNRDEVWQDVNAARKAWENLPIEPCELKE